MNKAEGEGLLSSEKIVYRGQWQNDLPHGEGHEAYSRISYYLGSFSNGKKNGFGHYQWNQLEFYEGDFKDNKIHGVGRYVTKEY